MTGEAFVGLRAAAWDQVAHPVWICDVATGRLVTANVSAMGLLGLTEETLPQTDLAAFDVAEVGALRAAADRAVERGSVAIRAHLRDARGGPPVAVVGTAAALDYGGCRYACFAVRRFDERFTADDALSQSQRLESIGLLAGGIAHDFNNLLTGVLGQVSLALAMLPDDSPAILPVNKAAAAAGRAAELTRQLLAYAGRGNFHIESIRVNEVIIENIGLFESMMPRGVRLSLELDPDVPPIAADRSQIQQVLMNLVLNAAEASADSGGTVTVRTDTWVGSDSEQLDLVGSAVLVPGRHVEIVISDTGSGMSAETLDKIFDPFFSTKGGGRGLGLSATLGIMRTHGGGLAVQSQQGEGTRFRVLIPIEPADALGAKPPGATAQAVTTEARPPDPTAQATTTEARPPDPTEPSVTGEASDPEPTDQPRAQLHGCVLIIDDEPAVREATADMLELVGMSVLMAVDGLDGVERFRERGSEIDVVLLDMKMPVMDGEAALRELRGLDPTVKVILMSGYNESEATRQFGAKGPAAFLQKPYDFDTLLAMVDSVLA